MNHGELNVLDLLIIGAYLLSMVGVGVYFAKRIRNTGDYVVGGHSFGPFILMATVCATIIGGSGLMGRAGVAYSSGFKAILKRRKRKSPQILAQGRGINKKNNRDKA